MCMVTQFQYSESQARNTTRGFILRTSPIDQVLWKLREKATFQHTPDQEPKNGRAKGSFQIVE